MLAEPDPSLFNYDSLLNAEIAARVRTFQLKELSIDRIAVAGIVVRICYQFAQKSGSQIINGRKRLNGRLASQQRAIGSGTVKAIGRQRTAQVPGFCRPHQTIPTRSFEFTQRAP
jgi:hypothetical protein